MKWLITGGCGFIGTSLIRRLVSEGGHQIRVVDNLSVGTREALREVLPNVRETAAAAAKPMHEAPEAELVVGDILDDSLAIDLAHGADVIVHLAANTGVGPSVEYPVRDCHTNVLGTLNYLEAARIHRVKRFVFASSGAPVGEVEPPIHEELAPHPVSPYGASKLAGEGYCSCYYRTFAVETVALRFGNVYGTGSGHKSSVVAKFINRAMAGEILEIYGNGKQTRDFIYIEDLVRAITLAATRENVGGEIFQIATNAETTVLEITEHLVKVMAEHGIGPVEIRHEDARLGDVMRNFSDTTKARIQLGWQPEYTLEQGLHATVAWFVERAAGQENP